MPSVFADPLLGEEPLTLGAASTDAAGAGEGRAGGISSLSMCQPDSEEQVPPGLDVGVGCYGR